MSVRSVTTIIIGGGQAGLAMSRELSQRGIDHLVLERGRVGEAWHSRRWESLRLQTPNGENGLPGQPYDGQDPGGFMPASEFTNRLSDYARAIDAPVVANTRVLGVTRREDGFDLMTDAGPYRSRMLVLATGACAKPVVPALANTAPFCVVHTTPAQYRRPSELPDGGVLVVGASASGVQLAAEIQASGRPVTLAVGNHLRLPRRYRGRDIEWWLDTIGALDERFDDVDDVERARRTPSPQLTGWPHPVDLVALQDRGVAIVGRLMEIRDGRALFSGGLANACAAADLKLARTRTRIDEWVAEHLPSAIIPAPEPLVPTPVPAIPRLQLDLRSGEIATVVWATGFRPDHSWLDLPVFDRRGRIDHHGGVVKGVPGLYALGLPFLRRRRSALISGAGPDARDLADHLQQRLGVRAAA